MMQSHIDINFFIYQPTPPKTCQVKSFFPWIHPRCTMRHSSAVRPLSDATCVSRASKIRHQQKGRARSRGHYSQSLEQARFSPLDVSAPLWIACPLITLLSQFSALDSTWPPACELVRNETFVQFSTQGAVGSVFTIYKRLPKFR